MAGLEGLGVGAEIGEREGVGVEGGLEVAGRRRVQPGVEVLRDALGLV